jgi:3-hydroxymyristoyl/3-hydroxydecanoyl-(acyl carrier protein) dehydratase
MRFLFVDRITELSQSLMAKGIKHVTRDDYYLCQDNAGGWCFIPSLIGETIGQLAAWHVMVKHDFRMRPVAGIAACATFYRPAYVGETVLLQTQIDVLDNTVVQYHGEARIDGELVFQLEGALGPLLPMDDFIDEALVRHQFNEINRPFLPTHVDNSSAAPFNRDAMMGNQVPPTSAPEMAFDRVVVCEAGVRIVAVKCITRAAPYFPDHFPNKPVLPMTVLLESFVNLGQEFIKRSGLNGSYVCQKVRRVKMSDFIYPGDIITGLMTLKHQTDCELVFVCRCDVSGKRVGVLEVTMILKGENE